MKSPLSRPSSSSFNQEMEGKDHSLPFLFPCMERFGWFHPKAQPNAAFRLGQCPVPACGAGRGALNGGGERLHGRVAVPHDTVLPAPCTAQR